MNKAMSIALAAAFILTAAGLALAGQEQVAFKFTGGLTLIQGNDYNRSVLGTSRFLGDTSESLVGGYKKLKSGRSLQVEVINYWGPHLGVGIGGGYYQVDNQSGVSGRAIGSDGEYTFTSTYLPKISAIPFFLNVHFKTRLATRLDLDVFAGPVFEIIQFGFRREATSSLNSLSEVETFKASGVSLGVQGGLDINIRLFRGIAVVAEGLYRGATITNLHGNWLLTSTTDSGTVTSSSSSYYFWSYDSVLGSVYPGFGFFDANGPTGAGISNARKARLNLSGLTATLGIRLSL